MNIDLLIMISFAVLMLLLVIWGWVSFQNFNHKLLNYAKSIDKLMKLNYELNKDLNELKKNFNDVAILDKHPITSEIDKHIDTKINEILALRISPMLKTLENFKNCVDEFKNSYDERVLNLEERTKSIGKITPPSFAMSEDKIENLFKNGKSTEEIAKELRISENKVIMVLKIRDLIG